jgi:hypothetical protein
LFNKPENWDYVGPIPAVEYYQPQFMSKEKKLDFEQFHRVHTARKTVFNFKQEFEDYCWSDCLLLEAGCLKFSKLARESSKLNENDPGFDPLVNCITLASACNMLYRRNYMPHDKIATLPHLGYNPRANISKICELWLKFLMHKNKIHIQHAKNSNGEFKCGSYYLDGVDHTNKLIFEMNGCLWHGCPTCYNPASYNPVTQSSFASLKYNQDKKIEYIMKHMPNYKVVELWEHSWTAATMHDPELKEWLKSQEIVSPLNIRDCLFGGRTNGLRLHHKCKPPEKIRYLDITSLYPSVQKYCRYPVGHPIQIVDNFGSLDNYFGIAKCKVLPPRALFLPVLPMRSNGKLVFTLCFTCATDMNKDVCRHTENERAIVGTWCTPELEKAVALGYTILKFYEIFHYPESEQYDPETKTGGIFTDYINNALKAKQEASGYPESVKSEQDKDDYISTYYEKEGVLLDKKKIAKNPGMRTLAKLQLNTLWASSFHYLLSFVQYSNQFFLF